MGVATMVVIKWCIDGDGEGDNGGGCGGSSGDINDGGVGGEGVDVVVMC